MAETRLGWTRAAWIAGLSALTLAWGLGGARRLSYHEAFVAQSAREMIASGDVLVPTLGGLPWLEKPPLAIWLVALSGRLAGGVGEALARAPSAASATLLALATALLAARRFGASAGLLAGLIQASTSWTVYRGQLAEADMLLACLIAWTLLAFDALRDEVEERRRRAWRRAFFIGLGLSALVKGIGFGAALLGATVVPVLLWERDVATLRRLSWEAIGDWTLAALLGLAWPALVLWRHPEALGFWAWHMAGRLGERPEHFASGPWWQYGPALLGQALPWSPLALAGACRSLPRALGLGRGRGGDAREAAAPVPPYEGGKQGGSSPRADADRDGIDPPCPPFARGGVVRPARRKMRGPQVPGAGAGDRLLWAWAVGPVALLSLASVKNPHYVIHALPPWSIWAALGLLRLGARLRRRGWPAARLRRGAAAGFAGLGLAFGVSSALLAPWLDRRGQGAEWAFYEDAGRRLRSTADEPLVLLYDDWDRLPYPTPFGPIPHDLGVRLFYLGRPACWRFGVEDLASGPPVRDRGQGRARPFAVLGRDRDVPALARLGRVETLARGPVGRARMSRVDDRTFRLYRVTPVPGPGAGAHGVPVARAGAPTVIARD